MLKAIISSRCLSNYRDLFNLCYLVWQWCSATFTFFLACGEIIVTLEDVANQLLLPILGDMDPNDIKLSTEERLWRPSWGKGWVEMRRCIIGLGLSPRLLPSSTMLPSSRFGFVVHLQFISPLCCKPFYFRLAIKISVEVSLPLGPMFLGHLYVQLDILQSDER